MSKMQQFKDPEQRRIAMMTMGWASFVAFFFAVQALISDIPERYIPLFIVATVCAVNVYFLRMANHSGRHGIVFVVVITVGIVIAIYTNGGIQSVAATWVLVIPFLAGLMGHFNVTVLGIVLAFLGLTLMLLIDLYVGPSPDLTPPEKQYQQNRLHQLGQLMTICICFLYFLVRVRDHEKALRAEIGQRIQAEDSAIQANKAKSQFLANMSHEIRTPLNGIVGLVPLAKDAKLKDEQLRFLNMIEVSANSLLSLVNDILDISKIEAGKMELEPVATDLKEVFLEISQFYQHRCSEKHLTMKLDLPGEAIKVIADVGKIRQITENLLSNAVKFTETGNVEFAVDVESINDKKRMIYIRVKDTGIGISPEQQEYVFESFVQADGTTTRNYGGTGLGLSICKELVELMGGSIQLQSQLGKGSEFTVSMPLEKQNYSTQNIRR